MSISKLMDVKQLLKSCGARSALSPREFEQVDAGIRAGESAQAIAELIVEQRLKETHGNG